MAILVRSLVKALVFVGLYVLALRFIHTYPIPMTDDQIRWWFAFSRKFDVHDPDDMWFALTFIANLIVTIFLYMGVQRLWKTLQARRQTARRG
jgi:hypothetical protein